MLWELLFASVDSAFIYVRHPLFLHDDVIKWQHFPRYWPFVRGIHRSPVNSPHQGQWRSALMFSLTCVWINGWVNNREAGDLRHHRAHYDVVVMAVMYLREKIIMCIITHTIYITKYAFGLRFVMFCCRLILVNYIYILQSYFTVAGNNHMIAPVPVI